VRIKARAGTTGRLALLWLAGMDLRVTLLALPPLLPLVSADLGLDRAAVGALTNLPVLLLGLASVLGSVIIGRLGASRALLVGLVTVAVAGALRGAGADAAVLFAMTFAMGVGIAVLQPTLPTLVRQWLPGATGPATALYGNGLLVGEALAASITLPAVLPHTGSWEASLAVWSAPVVLAAGLATWVSRRPEPPQGEQVPPAGPAPPRDDAAEGAGQPARAQPAPSWPDLGDARVWKLGLVQGGASAAYFATNTFLPGYLHAVGSPGLVSATLAALNVSQLPASILLFALSRRLVGPRWPFLALGGTLLAASAGLLAAPPPVLLAPVVAIGFSSSLLLLLTLALPPLWAGQREVARLSAGMFSVGYTLAFALPVMGGVASDASGSVAMTLAPALVGAVLVGLSAVMLPVQMPGRR
jgi:CP family cyanate transporter-like MFS transporter